MRCRGICTAGVSAVYLALGLSTAGATEDLTATQLLELFRAARGRYESLQATAEIVAFPSRAGERTGANHYRSRVTWRWSGTRRYVEEVYLAIDGKELAEADQRRAMYALTPQWSKSLSINAGEGSPRGQITRDPSAQAQIPKDVVYLMFDPFVWLGKIDPEKATVTSPTDDQYALKAVVKANGLAVSVTVDAGRGFVPLESRLILPQARGGMVSHFEDYREVADGIWLPFRVVTIASPPNASEELTIVQTHIGVRVNEPIADDHLNFAFPVGTIVKDRITNLRYRIEETGIREGDEPPVPTENSIGP